jgi:hypothetical protein
MEALEISSSLFSDEIPLKGSSLLLSFGRGIFVGLPSTVIALEQAPLFPFTRVSGRAEK